jgi:uncharacterized membrane protein
MQGASIIVIGAVALLILSGPLLLGFVYCTLNVSRKNPVKVETLFSGFNQFVNAMLLYIITTLLTILWSLLLVIPGIVKYYSYSMSFYILADNPGMSAEDARKQSMVLMKGNKWRLFCLHLSFIGWFILCALTCGILTFWVYPYLKTAETEFYLNLVHKDTEDVQNAPIAEEQTIEQTTDATNN